MLQNKCLKLFLVSSCYFLIATTTVVYGSDTQSSKQNTVSMNWCMKQIETIAQKENKCGSELSKTRLELEKSKGKQNGITEKVGIFALGCGVAIANFNPLALVAAGYLIIFQ